MRVQRVMTEQGHGLFRLQGLRLFAQPSEFRFRHRHIALGPLAGIKADQGPTLVFMDPVNGTEYRREVGADIRITGSNVMVTGHDVPRTGELVKGGFGKIQFFSRTTRGGIPQDHRELDARIAVDPGNSPFYDCGAGGVLNVAVVDRGKRKRRCGRLSESAVRTIDTGCARDQELSACLVCHGRNLSSNYKDQENLMNGPRLQRVPCFTFRLLPSALLVLSPPQNPGATLPSRFCYHAAIVPTLKEEMAPWVRRSLWECL